jgi:hypothetical protein
MERRNREKETMVEGIANKAQVANYERDFSSN